MKRLSGIGHLSVTSYLFSYLYTLFFKSRLGFLLKTQVLYRELLVKCSYLHVTVSGCIASVMLRKATHTKSFVSNRFAFLAICHSVGINMYNHRSVFYCRSSSINIFPHYRYCWHVPVFSYYAWFRIWVDIADPEGDRLFHPLELLILLPIMLIVSWLSLNYLEIPARMWLSSKKISDRKTTTRDDRESTYQSHRAIYNPIQSE